MQFLKRIFLFMLVNMLVVITISFILNILGVGPYITNKGLNLETLAIFCLIWGMVGSFISLGISRIMAKWMMGVKVINPAEAAYEERDLLNTIYKLSQKAGLKTMPEVGVYDSPDFNAFATGPTKSRALVAVSSGLLRGMNKNELEGVLGHEIAHIANGDMVTMTLIQGIVNAFVMFLSRVLAWTASQALSGKSDERESSGPGLMYFVFQIVFEILFMILGTIVVSWFSRQREFRADIGGAQLAGKQKMIAALEALKRMYEIPDMGGAQPAPALQSLQISNRKHGWFALFSTHPDLNDRIERLKSQMSVF